MCKSKNETLSRDEALESANRDIQEREKRIDTESLIALAFPDDEEAQQRFFTDSIVVPLPQKRQT